LRGLRRYDDAVAAFSEGAALEVSNPEWEKEIARTRSAQAEFEKRRKAKEGSR